MCICDNKDKYLEMYPEAKYCLKCGKYVHDNEYHKHVDPVLKYDDTLDHYEETHPSYGNIVITRFSGGSSNFYGSAITHNHGISIKITPSKKISSDYNEWYYSSNNPIIEVVLSPSQFAEAITSIGIGEGTPCTIKSVKGEYLPVCPERNLEQEANDKLKNQMTEFASKYEKSFSEIRDMLDNKKTILKGDRKKIMGFLNSFMQDLEHNLPFLHECMIEAYDKAAMSAKADIEAFYNMAVHKLGINAIEETKTKGIEYE